MEFLELQKP